ncbi:MAG: arsenate reductase (glutaredoxin) [Gammaproteobacteria bacterium]
MRATINKVTAPHGISSLKIDIYHNSRCSKSRQTLQLLRDRGFEPRVVTYLDTPPDAAELAAVASKLGVAAIDIMRTGEPPYRKARDDIDAMSEAERFEWLAANPIVMQRPIVIHGDRARIGRPPESVLDILPQ